MGNGSAIRQKRPASDAADTAAPPLKTQKRSETGETQQTPEVYEIPDTPESQPTGDAGYESRLDLSLSEDYVRSLLPGAMFGLSDELFARQVWSVDHEGALLSDFHTSADFAAFSMQQMRLFTAADGVGTSNINSNPVPAKHGRLLEAELRLWEVLQHRFRCGLDDLFRYGLRPDIHSHEDDGGGTFSDRILILIDYCETLTTILTHPIWPAGNVAYVRWLLQRVVQARVPGHARPLVPPYSYARWPFADTARQWGFDASMRMSLGLGSMGHAGGLAAASREAANDAAVAEAEMAWFLFSANMPRDLWMLDRGLVHIDEPGCPPKRKRAPSSTSSSPFPFGLRVCDAILNGDFGGIAFSKSDLSEDWEVVRRQNARKREDTVLGYGVRQEAREEAKGSHVDSQNASRQRAASGSAAADVSPASLADEQVFFDLRLDDLRRLLGLLERPHFLERSGFAAPSCYYVGYVKAHQIFGYGADRAVIASADDHATAVPAGWVPQADQPRPLLTCYQCAQKYFQGNLEHQDGDDSDDCLDSSLRHHHRHRHHHHHHHMVHQQFVRSLPSSEALEWLLRRKAEWLLAGQREQRIQATLATLAAMSAQAGGREEDADADADAARPDGRPTAQAMATLLPDVPPFDPAPQGHLDRVFTHPTQLAFLARLRHQPHASVLWCLPEGQQQRR